MGQVIGICSFLLALLSSSLVWAYDVAVMPVKGTNLPPGQAEAIGVLLTQQYAKASGYQVAGPEVTREALKGGGDYVAAARTLGAGEYLESTGVMLESKLILTVERHDSTGRVLHSASMPASTMDDVPEISERIARALLLRTSTDETRTIDNVTKQEGEPKNQTYSVVPKGVKGSVVMPFVKGVDLEPMASMAFELRIEKRDYFLGFAVGVMLPANTDKRIGYGNGFLEFSGNYFLNHESFAPYVGAGVSPRIQAYTGGGGIGFAPFGHFGVMFPRDSRARALLELRIAQNVLPMAKSGSSTGYSSNATSSTTAPTTDGPLSGKYPTEASLQFGLVW